MLMWNIQNTESMKTDPSTDIEYLHSVLSIAGLLVKFVYN